MSIRQLVVENPQTFESVDRIVEEQQNVEQLIEHPVEQQAPYEKTTLRRSTLVKNLAIPSDYVMYLQESDYTNGV